VERLIDRLCSDLLDRARQAIAARGRFDLALSGGSTPRILFKRLVTGEWRGRFPWDKVHIWQVDERVVPHSDEHSNWGMIESSLTGPLGLSPQQMHPMPVLDPDGASVYESILVAQTGGILDFALLGMGDDGHTASLFPHSPALGETRRLALFNDGETVAEPRPRLTLTYPALRVARRLGVLVTGTDKRAILAKVAASVGQVDVGGLPILGVIGAGLTWYVDGGALPAG
jgi:6-phosphogluconolactonase